MAESLSPTTFEEAASALAGAAQAGHAVRIRGAGTKLGWINSGGEPDVVLDASGLDRVLEHNAGDLTAVLEAGIPLERAQEAFAAAGQMLALDPPLGRPGEAPAATIGGIVATGDSGPLRHRYGTPRDLLLGMTVALSDGTIARSGGKVIKNVAGYDIGKLFSGSFGTLGMILSVAVRLHPLPVAGATALGASPDASVLSAAAVRLTGGPFELDALDLAWRGGRGGLLARVAGVEATRRAERVAGEMRAAGLDGVEVVAEDDALWSRQRAGQRSAAGAVVRLGFRPTVLPAVLAAVDAASGTLVARAALGIGYVEIRGQGIALLREHLPAGTMSVLLDVPEGTPAERWMPGPEGAALELMRRVKSRFDPPRACNPGVFVGGI